MKKLHFIPLGLAIMAANMAYAADEIHYTITGQNSVTFDWRGTATENSIGYGVSSGAYTQVTAVAPKPLPNSSQGPFWEAKLTGLKENTLYYYSIGGSPERTFRTAPALGSSGFTVYAQGDIGDTSSYFNMGAVQDLIANGQPSFVIGLGNLAWSLKNGKAAIDQHFNDVMTWSKQAAYMPVWGDQEWEGTGNVSFANFKGRFDLPNPQASPGSPLAGGKDWNWYDYGNARFISLPEPSVGAWPDWSTKADALMAQAQTDPKIQYIVTLGYQSAYSSGHVPGSATLKVMLDKLGDRYSKYVLNLNSRSRNYERSYPQHGVVHVTAGIGGVTLAQDGTCLWLTCAKPTWSAFRAMHQGALKLNFNATGIDGSFICGPNGGGGNDVNCVKGSVVDSFKIAAPAAAVSNVAATANANIVTATASASITSINSCTQAPLNVSAATSDGGFAYVIFKPYGTLADNENSETRSTLILFENGLQIGPAHSVHANIRSLGQGRFSHWSRPDGTAESVRFSATNNTDPRTNGKSYTYCRYAGGAASDTQAPSVPSSFKATTISSSKIALSWLASTDNQVVTGYKVYRNNVQIGTSATPGYTDSGLTPAKSYTYTVSAIDEVGNTSALSTASTAITSAVAPVANAVSTDANCAPDPTSSLVVNVKDKGAKGNGSANDTAAIQAAINQVAGSGGTVLVPDGSYMIDAVVRLYLKSNMTLRMSGGATLKAIPTSNANYNVLRIENASNVNVIGGKVQGERSQHQGTSGEWGNGVSVLASKNVVIEGVVATDMWGDGFYISKNSSNVTACSVTADNNRRQGLTITAANGVVVKNSIFKNTNGVEPQSGVQLEPNANEAINNVQILNSQALGNKGWGMKLTKPASGSAITNVTLNGNTISGNGANGGADGIVIVGSSGHRITNNIVKNNLQAGISLVEGSLSNTVTGNTVTNNGASGVYSSSIGIQMWDRATKNTVINNTVTGHQKNNIRDFVGGNTITPNTVN